MSTKKTTRKGLPATATVDFEVRAPFRILEDNRRKFIRVDVDAPLSYTEIKTGEGGFWPDCDGPKGTGEIINISAGGILMFVEEPLMEKAILSMSLQLEGCITLDNILGKVKRVEIDSGGYLVGVETITRESLADNMSQAEIDQLPENLSSFNERLRRLLNEYVYSKKLSEETT